MIRHTKLEPRFVKGVPRDLEPGVLYVSMEYGTVVHSCCCGCAQEVVTPLTPTDWRLTYNGETISLWPSIGNWNLPCQSHYIIDRNRVIGAGRWNKERIEAERQRDKAAKAEFYWQSSESAPIGDARSPKSEVEVFKDGARTGIWSRLRSWLD